jgi:hypothetical protein
MARAGLTPGLNKWDSPIVTEESKHFGENNGNNGKSPKTDGLGRALGYILISGLDNLQEVCVCKDICTMLVKV